MTDNAATITAFLRAQGLNETAISGALGNLSVESGLSPTAYNANEGAIGIAQWEGGRRSALQSYAAAHGMKETDLNAQLGYLWQELSGPYAGVLGQLRTSTSPADAATIWDAQYEVSAGTTRAARIANANAYAQGLPSGGAKVSIPGGATGAPANWLTDAAGVAAAPGLALLGGFGSALTNGASKAAGDLVAPVLGSVQRLAVLGVFLAGGVALVLIGANRAAAPARDNVEQKLAPLAVA